MIHLDYAHVCEHAILSTGGTLSVIGIFSQIKAKSFPVTHPKMFVVAHASGTVGEYDLEISIVRLADEKVIVGPIPMKVKINEQHREAGIIGELSFVRFEQPGEYQARLTSGRRTVGTVNFTLSPAQ